MMPYTGNGRVHVLRSRTIRLCNNARAILDALPYQTNVPPLVTQATFACTAAHAAGVVV